MAYGKIKADTLVYDNSGSDVEKTVASLAAAAPTADPTFTGTVTIPTASANDNTTKAASTAYVQTELVDYAPLAAPALTGTATAVNLTLSGNLTVNGTTTTVNTATLEVEDKNIELGKVSSPSDTTADGGGITLKGATDKTINWVNSTDRWTFNQGIEITVADNTVYSATANTVNGLRIYNDSNVDNGFAGIELSSTDGDDYTGSVLLKGIADGTNYSSDFVIQTRHSGAYGERLRIQSGGAAEFSSTVTGTTISDSKGDVRSIPQNHKTGAYVLLASDAGKCITITTGGVTVNTSIFSAGDAVTIINHSGSDQTITQGSSFTLHNTADAATGNRTLAGRGMATIWFENYNEAYISGAGLS